MCSIHADDDLALEAPPDPIPAEKLEQTCKLLKCRKCGAASAIAVRPKECYCQQCFLLQCRQKFRATFGKARLIQKGDRALLAFSGGVSSSCLLGLTLAGLSDGEQRKLRYIPTVCYVDECRVHGWTEDVHTEVLEDVSKALSKSPFPYCVIPLELVFSSDTVLDQYYSYALVTPSITTAEQPSDLSATNDRDAMCDRSTSHGRSNDDSGLPLLEAESRQLERCIAACSSLTAKEDMIQTLRTRLLSALAGLGLFQWVLSGESCTRLVIRTLSDIAKGKGAMLPHSTAFADRREKHTTFLRPLREFSSKEIAFYCHCQDMTIIQPAEIASMVPENASLDRLTEAFVHGLQAGFSSTVSTVFRTSEKLSMAGGAAVSDEICVLCGSPMDLPFGSDTCSELFTKARSAAGHMLSGGGALSSGTAEPPPATVKQLECASGDGNGALNGSAGCGGACSCSGESDSLSSQFTPDMLKPFACYGCRVLLHDMKQAPGGPVFPARVTRQAQVATNRSKMREQIKDFLLEDD